MVDTVAKAMANPAKEVLMLDIAAKKVIMVDIVGNVIPDQTQIRFEKNCQTDQVKICGSYIYAGKYLSDVN